MDVMMLEAYFPVVAVFVGAVLGSWFSSIASSESADPERRDLFDKLQKAVGIIMVALLVVSAAMAAGQLEVPAMFALFMVGYVAGIGGSYVAKGQKKVTVG